MKRILAMVISVLVLVILSNLAPLAQGDSCPANYEGFLAPRLQVGERGLVVPGGSGNRVRNNPATDGDQVGTLPPGTEFMVIGGPACDSSASIIWWQVRSDDGLEGWTAEGLPPDDYFLEPVIPPGPTAAPTATPTPRPTSTPSPTPTLVPFAALDLPALAALSPDNITHMAVESEIPTSGGAITAFLSPDMAYLFMVRITEQRSYYVSVYTFPEMQPVAQGLPFAGYIGAGTCDCRGVLFAPEPNLMVSAHLGRRAVVFYEPGAPYFDVESEFRTLHSADLNNAGILALSFSSLREQDAEPMLCFIDRAGSTYAPDDRLCLPQTTSIRFLTFLSDGRRVLAGSLDGLTLYDALTGDVLQTFDYSMEVGGTMAIVPGTEAEDGLPTVLISKEGFILSVNLATGVERSYPNGEGRYAYAISFSADTTQMMLLVRGPHVPDVLAVDIATRSILHRDLLFGGEGAAYSPDGRLAFINNAVFETQTWQQLVKLRGDQHIMSFSPDGTLLFVWNSSKHAFELYGVPDE